MTGNNVPLTEPPKPDVLNPAPLGPLAGNHHDDDGRAIDEYFEAPSHSPVETEGLEPVTDELPAPTRILNTKVTLGTDPVPALPVDMNRLMCNIISFDGYVIAASEKSDCYFAPTVPPNQLFTLNGHTGAIWIHTTDNASIGKTVTIQTVTK